MDFDFELVEKNIKLEPIQVRHQDLIRVNDSVFRSKCTSCEEGVLFMQRDMNTFKLQTNDMCSWCGRRFVYTDIKESISLEYEK